MYFRFDCRVFLQDLSEKTIGSTIHTGSDEFGDDIEEEMCEVERYRDLKSAKMEVETEKQQEKQKRGAEFSFNYEENAADDDGLSGSDDEEDNQPYEPPKGVKMPVGINMVRLEMWRVNLGKFSLKLRDSDI